MIEVGDRVARAIVRARYLALGDHAVVALDAALRGGTPGPAVSALADALRLRGAAVVGAMLALAFGGADPSLDAVDAAALTLACAVPGLRQAFLDRVDPAAPGWLGLASALEARGVAPEVFHAALGAHAAAWVALDGALSAAGGALVAALDGGAPAPLKTLLAQGGDARELVVARLLRAVLAGTAEVVARARATLRALPPGARGAAADPMLARDAETFVGDIVWLAAEGGDRADRLAALEALLRHRHDAALPFVDEILAGAEPDAEGLRSQMLLTFGRREPSRFSARALAQVQRDPGPWAAELAAAWPTDRARPVWEALRRANNPDLADRAVAALLAAPHPERGALAVALLREPGIASREVVIEACAALDASEATGLAAVLAESTSELRLAAVRALAPHREVAEALLSAHYAVERSGRVRAAIAATLGYAPTVAAATAPDDPALAALLARVEATRVAVGKRGPRWLGPVSAPLRWRDGGEAPVALGLHLVLLQSRRGSVEPDPELVEVARRLDPADRALWAEALLDAWVRADAPAKDHGVLLLAALLGGELAVVALREAIPAWHRSSRRALAVTATQLLAMRASDEALRALDALAAAHPHESFGVLARGALDEEARTRGAAVEEMLDAAAPAFGLDAENTAELDLGFHQIRVRRHGATVSLFDGDGAPLHGLPRPGRRDDPAKAAAVRRALKLLHELLPDALAREQARVFDAMSSGRRWTAEALCRDLAHPLRGSMLRALWWDVDGRPVRGRELPASPAELARATLMHPATSAAALEDDVGAPFPQMSRGWVALPPSARDAVAWEALVGRTLIARGERGGRVVAPWTRGGWVPGTVVEGLCHAFTLRFTAARVDAVLDVAGIALWSEEARSTRVGALRFVAWDAPGPLALGDVPPPLFSEAVVRADAMLVPQR